MYAIIADGPRQYQVEEGQELDLAFREVSAGDRLTFDRVLAIRGPDGLQVGKPVVPSARVTAEVLGPIQGEKISVRKIRRRKNSRRHTGHRSIYTRVKIEKIEV